MKKTLCMSQAKGWNRPRGLKLDKENSLDLISDRECHSLWEHVIWEQDQLVSLMASTKAFLPTGTCLVNWSSITSSIAVVNRPPDLEMQQLEQVSLSLSIVLAFVYVMSAAALNLTYEEEFEDMSDISKNMICGFVSGAIYKSTLGWIPMGVGALLGGSVIGAMTLVNQYAYERGYVNFEMKIWYITLYMHSYN